MGQMSHDRVRFTLTDTERNRSANINAAIRAFGIDRHTAGALWDNQARIVCRPSQFARFLIYRSGDVDVNGFIRMKPELFTPQPVPVELDVSKNPADICDD